MIARENCRACRGEGVIKTKCCGPRFQYDCCCGYGGGWTEEVCPDCEAQEEAAPGSHPDAA